MSDQKKADRGKAKQVDQPPEKPPADIQHDHGVDGWVLPGLTTGCYYIKLDRRASDSGVLRADNNLRGVHFRTGGYYANKAPVSKDTVGFFFRAHGPGTRPFILHVASCETEVRGEKVPAVIIEFSHWLACEITRDTFRMPWAVEKFGFSVLGAAGAFDEHELLPDKTMGELVLSQPIEGSSQSTSSVSAGGQHQNAAPGMGSASGGSKGNGKDRAVQSPPSEPLVGDQTTRQSVGDQTTRQSATAAATTRGYTPDPSGLLSSAVTWLRRQNLTTRRETRGSLEASYAVNDGSSWEPGADGYLPGVLACARTHAWSAGGALYSHF